MSRARFEPTSKIEAAPYNNGLMTHYVPHAPTDKPDAGQIISEGTAELISSLRDERT